MADKTQKNFNREQRRRRLFEALEAERERARTVGDALQQERHELAVYERSRREDEERRRRDLEDARRAAEGLRRDIEIQRAARETEERRWKTRDENWQTKIREEVKKEKDKANAEKERAERMKADVDRLRTERDRWARKYEEVRNGKCGKERRECEEIAVEVENKRRELTEMKERLRIAKIEMENVQAQLKRATAKAVSAVADKERAERAAAESRNRERRSWEEGEARRRSVPEKRKERTDTKRSSKKFRGRSAEKEASQGRIDRLANMPTLESADGSP